MRAYDFENYKEFLIAKLQSLPNRGRGESRKLAEVLKTHTTRISHLLHGDVHLTPEQAIRLSQHFGLTALETEFILASLHEQRAGTADLRAFHRRQIEEIRKRGLQLAERVVTEKTLSETDRARFYSSWTYSAVRLATSIEAYRDLDALAAHFNLPRAKIREILDFLLATGLCVEKDGKLAMGPRRTHLEAGSPLIARHHSNWRIKAIERHERITDRELAFSSPVSIHPREQAEIREQLAKFVERFYAIVEKSEPADRLACLNIDWFEPIDPGA